MTDVAKMIKTSPEARHEDFHGHAQYPQFCARCKAELDEQATAAEDYNAVEINYWVDALITAATEAGKHINLARAAIGRLTSDQVYDIEFAEAAEGDDVSTELENAALSLRHVARIAKARKALLSA